MPARQGPKRQDYTGRERERLAKEHQQEIQERSKEITLNYAVEAAEADEAVYDPTTQEVVSESPKAQEVKTQYIEKKEATEPEDLTQDPINVAAANNAPPIQYDEHLMPDNQPQVITIDSRGPRIVRAAEDIDSMTVGHGTSYTMEQGKQYRVPANVADWMEHKGLVWH